MADAVTPERVFAQFFTLNGLGDADMAVDGSATPKQFWVIAVGGELLINAIAGLVVSMKIEGDTYGKDNFLAAGEGLTLEIVDTDGTTVLTDVLGGDEIRSLNDWGIHGGATSMLLDKKFNESWSWAIDIDRHPTGVLLKPGQRVRVTVRGDLSGLAKHQIKATGFYL